MGFIIRSSDTVALNGIRQLVSANLDSTTLTDSLIASDVFVRAAELRIFKLLGYMSDQAYLTAIGSNAILNKFPLNFTYKGDYGSSANTSFNQYDVVYDGTNLYYANKDIATKPSALNIADWVQIDVNFEGLWSARTYNLNDVIDNSGTLYFAKSSFTSTSPFTDSNWTQITPLTGTNLDKSERIKIAIEYQAAILLILSLPQLIEEQILRERVRFQEIDWEKRNSLYESLISDILDKVSDDPIFTTSSAVFGCVPQKLAL